MLLPLHDYNTLAIASNDRDHVQQAWASAAADPAVGVADWLLSGAPAGICSGMPELAGLFPGVEDVPGSMQVDDLHTDLRSS